MIDWDLRKFRMLRELERQGTVTAAAEALSMTPSAVSQALAALGRQVGGPVVEPVGRRVRLTELAHILLEHGRTVFAQLEQAEADVEAYLGGAAGVVRVGSFATGVEALLVPSLDLLRESRPTLRVEIREAEASDVFSLLEQGDIDLGLSLAAQAHTDPDARFTRFPLLADPLDVALPAGHRLADKTGLRLADLADEPWVYGASGPWREITLAVCASAGFVPRPAHHAADWGVILSLVQAGMGVALIPRLVDSRRPGVRVRVLAADRPRRHVTGAVRRGAEVAPRFQEVMRCLRAVAEERRRLHPAM